MSDYEDAISTLEDPLGLGLRRRPTAWDPDRESLSSSNVPGLRELLEDDDDASVLEGDDDDGAGCPLPSTPVDENLLDCQVGCVALCYVALRYVALLCCCSALLSCAVLCCVVLRCLALLYFALRCVVL